MRGKTKQKTKFMVSMEGMETDEKENPVDDAEE
jgi:hypothetical protein